MLGHAHEIVVRPRIHAPGDVELVIADLRHSDLADPATLRSLCSFGPVLVLVDRRDPVPPAVEENRNLHVLRKPFDGFELRLIVDRMLGTRPGIPAVSRGELAEDDDAHWLEFPYVPDTGEIPLVAGYLVLTHRVTEFLGSSRLQITRPPI